MSRASPPSLRGGQVFLCRPRVDHGRPWNDSWSTICGAWEWPRATTAYGYSVTVTCSFAVLTVQTGPVRIGHVFLFVAGAGLAFAVVNTLVTRGFRQRVKQEPPVVLALASSFSIVSASAAVGLAALLGAALGGWAAWLLGSLLPTWVYLGVSALELALARNVHLTVRDVDPEDR